MCLPEQAWERESAPLMNDYSGHVFEDVCLQFMKRQIVLGSIPMLYDEFGFWQGPNPKLKRTEDIDVVLSGKNDLLACECKWRNEAAGIDALETLKDRAELIRNGLNVRYALFSKSGFTDEVQRAAREMNDVTLYGLADLLE